MRAVLYLRLSAVADDSTSIVRQERDLREHAARQGWEVVAVLADEGISGRKARAKAEEAVRMIRDDEADVLAVWKLDRFTRQGWDGIGDALRAIDSREKAGRPALFVALQDGNLTSDAPAFRLLAGILSEVARTEAENGATRARNAMHFRRTVADRYAGGSTVPFGYRSVPAPDGVGRVLVLDEAEAAIVREVAERLLAREPISAVSRDLVRRGIPASKSAARRAARRGEPTEGLDRGSWNPTTVVALWTADSLLGRVTHRGDLVRDEHGLPRSVWPPVLDLATLERLRARLRPNERRPRQRRAARLLSGLAYCASCGTRMHVTTSGGRAVYACRSSWNLGDCPSPKVDAVHLETYVEETFLRIAGSEPVLALVDGPATSAASDAARREIDAALREATAAMLDDDADLATLSARVAALKAEKSALPAPVAPAPVYAPTGRTFAEAWPDVALDERREYLASAFDHLTVSPTTSRGRFDAGRISFAWLS